MSQTPVIAKAFPDWKSLSSAPGMASVQDVIDDAIITGAVAAPDNKEKPAPIPSTSPQPRRKTP